MVEDFRANGVNADLMYHYFDEEISIAESNATDYDLTFVGSSGCGSRQHTNRYWMLYYMLRNTDIKLFLDEQIPSLRGCEKGLHLLIDSLSDLDLQNVSKRDIKNQVYRLAISNHYQSLVETGFTKEARIPAYKLSEAFPTQCLKPVYGNDYYEIISKSRISFDIHSDFAKGYSVALRLFHATGCRSCLVDKGKNLDKIFDIDREVVAYSSPEEAKDKARYLLDNPSITREIANAGYKRTLRDHSSVVRANELTTHISQLFRA